MNQAIVRIVGVFLLLLLVVAPFAGLAPLLLFLLVAGVGSSILSLIKVLLLGSSESDRKEASP
jgi:hypothetical protein